MLLTLLLRAQTEHAIGQSYPTGTAENHRNPEEGEAPSGVGMTIDEDCRDPKANSHEHA